MTALSPIRRRTRPAIPRLDMSRGPHPLHASIDQLRINFPRTRIRFADIERLRHYVGVLGETELFSSNVANRSLVLTVRSHWLFGGEVRVYPGAQSENGQARAHVQLTLNPTRFIAHHPLTVDEMIATDPAVLLRKSDQAERSVGATTLDGRDNMMPPNLWARARSYPGYVTVYVQKVLDLLNYYFINYADNISLTRHLDLPDLSPTGEIRPQDVPAVDAIAEEWDYRVITDWSEWVVQRAEVYWEYRVPDATSYVHALYPHLVSLASDSTAQSYPVHSDLDAPVPARRPSCTTSLPRRNPVIRPGR